MDRIPFGISRLDSMIQGGAPTGSVVLLAGDAGAGAREFLYTCGIMNGLAREDRDLFQLHYGSLANDATLPENIHYVSLTQDGAQVRDEMRYVLTADMVSAGSEAMEFVDLSPEYFQLSPVPREWYADQTPDIEALGSRNDRDDIFDALGDYLDEYATGNLMLLDSISDLVSLVSGEHQDIDWADLVMLLKGLKRASHNWGGMILLLVNGEALRPSQLGMLMDACDGTIMFEWESGGSERARTMVVRQFRGVLSQLEEENIVQFETDIGDAGFDISDVRKIR